MNIKLSEELRIIALVALTNIAADTTTTGTGVASGVSLHQAMGIVQITSVAGGADDTYTFTIEGSNTAIDSGFALAHAAGEPSTMPATQPGGAQIIKIGLKPFKWYRYVLVTANGADVTFLVNVVLQPSKLPAAAQAAA